MYKISSRINMRKVSALFQPKIKIINNAILRDRNLCTLLTSVKQAIKSVVFYSIKRKAAKCYLQNHNQNSQNKAFLFL